LLTNKEDIDSQQFFQRREDPYEVRWNKRRILTARTDCNGIVSSKQPFKQTLGVLQASRPHLEEVNQVIFFKVWPHQVIHQATKVQEKQERTPSANE